MIFSSWHFLFNNRLLWFLKINLLCWVLPISHVPSLSWQRERREWMPGVKTKGKHQIVGRILGQNREVYLGTWLVHFKSVSHTFMSRMTCQVYVNVFMISYFEPNFIVKFLWESGFSNFGRNRNDVKWKSVIWPPFWNGTNILYFFYWNMVVISVYTYGVKIIKQFRWESSFLWGGYMEPPLCTNGSAGYLMQLGVKVH